VSDDGDPPSEEDLFYTGPLVGPVRPGHPVFIYIEDPGGERAQINLHDGRLYMTDESGDLVESYDWARLGRIAYRTVMGRKEPPTNEESGT